MLELLKPSLPGAARAVASARSDSFCALVVRARTVIIGTGARYNRLELEHLDALEGAALAVALLYGCAHDQWSCPPPSFQN